MKLLKKKSIKKVSADTPKFTDLKSVMDYSRNLSMFYSGVEYGVYLEGCYNMGVRNFLMSYEYARTKGASELKKYDDIHLFIDSGAFTYMSDPKYENYTIEQWEEQIQSYLKWAELHKDSIFAIAELDLQMLLGLDVVEGWRRKYFEPFMLRTGIPVCFIYHEEDMSIWERMCQRYPYVGVSTATSETDLNTLKEHMRIAEKYNSLVHGFGMTTIDMLKYLPFYTVDSTTWKVGFRYGQIVLWKNNKVYQRQVKDWDQILPVLSSYKGVELDLDKIHDYYEPEVLRANVFAFQQAEEFIIDRLKSMTYWKKARAVKTDVNNLPPDFFPSIPKIRSFRGKGDLTEYAKKFNINQELDFEELKGIITELVTFCNWYNPDYEEFVNWYKEEENLKEVDNLHEMYVNRIVPDLETKVADLRLFYFSCISGDNDKLLHLGTNFDRTVKERDSYIEDDDEFDLVDVSNEEIKSRLSRILPSGEEDEGMPEIEALDEEVCRKLEIVPTFDSRGKFVKGQVAVRNPKKVYSKKYPKVSCDTCYAAQKCPEYKAGYVCAFNKMFDRFDTRDMKDVLEAMQGMANFSLARMQRAMIIENLTGNFDPNVTNLINQNMGLLRQLDSVYKSGAPEVLRQTQVLRADGTREQVTQVMNPQSGGILEKLFGGVMSAKGDDEDEANESPEVIEATARIKEEREKAAEADE